MVEHPNPPFPITLDHIKQFATREFSTQYRYIPGPAHVKCKIIDQKELPSGVLSGIKGPYFRVRVGSYRCLQSAKRLSTYIYLGKLSGGSYAWVDTRSCGLHQLEIESLTWHQPFEKIFQFVPDLEHANAFLYTLALYYLVANQCITELQVENNETWLGDFKNACKALYTSVTILRIAKEQLYKYPKGKIWLKPIQRLHLLPRRSYQALPEISSSTNKFRQMNSNLKSRNEAGPGSSCTSKQNDSPITPIPKRSRGETPDIEDLENFSSAHKRLKTDNAALQAQVSEAANLKKEVEQLRSQVKEITAKLAEQEQKRTEAEQAREVAEVKIIVLEGEKDMSKWRLEEQKEKLKTYIADM